YDTEVTHSKCYSSNVAINPLPCFGANPYDFAQHLFLICIMALNSSQLCGMTAAEPFLTDRIFETRPETFDAMCLEVFRFQYAHNRLDRQFGGHLRRQADQINHSEEIPLLPIRCFRDHCIKTTEFEPEVVFESSAPTADTVSRHYVRSTALYEQSFTKSFTEFFGDPSGYAILALLPSYLERGNSSLVYMVQHLMKLSGQSTNGFYLYDHAALAGVLERNIRENIPTILFGVTYALLDFSE